MSELPHLNGPASEHFTYRDLCHCGVTWQRTRIDNVPTAMDTYGAIARLCNDVLEPVLRTFGRPKLTYGFAGAELTKHIKGRVAPRLDQHAGYERRPSCRMYPC